MSELYIVESLIGRYSLESVCKSTSGSPFNFLWCLWLTKPLSLYLNSPFTSEITRRSNVEGMMKPLLLILIVAAIAVASAQIQPDLRRQSGTLTRNQRRGSIHRTNRRDDIVPINVRHDDELGVYFVTAVIGTPGQTLDLQVRSDQAIS